MSLKDLNWPRIGAIVAIVVIDVIVAWALMDVLHEIGW